MDTYRQDGAAKVYWLTVMTPRDADAARVDTVVNAAIRVAAQPWASQVRVVDTVPDLHARRALHRRDRGRRPGDDRPRVRRHPPERRPAQRSPPTWSSTASTRTSPASADPPTLCRVIRRFALGATLIVVATAAVAAVVYSPPSSAEPTTKPPVELTVTPASAPPKTWIRLRYAGDHNSLINVGTSAWVEDRRHGSWRPIDGMASRRAAWRDPDKPYWRTHSYASLLDALMPGTPDYVQVPPLRPGWYRIAKGITYEVGGDAFGRRIHAGFRVTRAAD